MEQSPLPEFRSSPVQAIQAVISSPNWVGNLLWLSLAALSSSIFIGQIGLFGYGAELLEKRSGRPENPSLDVDSNRLGDYISKGIWPFLVQFLVQIAVSIVIFLPIMLLMFGGMAVGAAAGGDAGVMLSTFAVFPVVFFLSILANLVTVPFIIRGMVCQDFQKAFDLGWAMDFIRRMFWEIVTSSIVFGILAACIAVAGLILLCVGYIPAIGLIMGGAVNLLAQWYEIYLSRGGMPAPSPDDIVDATIVT